MSLFLGVTELDRNSIIQVANSLLSLPDFNVIDPVNVAPQDQKSFIFNELPDISDPDNPTRNPIPSQAMFNTNVAANRTAMLQDNYYPMIFDLGEDHIVTRFYYFDGAGAPSVRLYRTSSTINEFELVATLNTGNFNQWKYIEIPANQQVWRYYMVETQSSNFPETFVAYGRPTNPPVTYQEPPIQRITPSKTFDQIAGICTFPDITPALNGEFYFARFYVDARWMGDDNTGEFMINPSNFSGGMDLIQAFQDNFNAGVKIDFNTKEAPRHLDSAYDNKDRLTGTFEPDNKWIDTPTSDPNDPTSYTWYSQLAYNIAAIFGSTVVPVGNLNNVKAGQTITTGLNIVRTFSFGNEIDLYWRGSDGHFKAREFAALLSACIDGHKGAISNGGIKTADSNAKIGTSGTIFFRPDYLNAAFKYAAAMRNETLEQFLTNIEHIELHHYSNDGGGQIGPRNVGISPTADNLRGKLREWREYADRYWPGIELYLGEWGYDENPAGFPADQYAPAIIDSSNSRTKAAWMQQGYAMCHVEQLDSFAWYMIRHTASSVGRYATCGFLSRTEEKLFTWYAFTAMQRVLTGFSFNSEINLGDSRLDCYKFDNGNQSVYMIFANTSVDLRVPNVSVNITGLGFQSCTEVRPTDGVEGGAKGNLDIVSNSFTIAEVSEMPVYVLCTPNLPLPVMDVTRLYLTSVTNNSVTLQWNNTSSSASGIRIYRKLRSEGSYVLHDTVSPFLNSYTDTTNVAEDTLYDYSIRPFNSQGEASGIVISAKTDVSTLTLLTTYRVDFRRSTTTLPPVATYNIFNDAFSVITLDDIAGVTSTYQLDMISGMTFFQDTGATTGDNSGVVPDDVLKEHLNMPGTSNTGILELLNVPVGVRVKVRAVCSKTFTSSRNILLRVGDNTIFFNALDNTSQFVEFPMIEREVGDKVTIEFTRIDGDDAIINALWFEIYN